ncbi:hypothetical protein GCE9029_01021 [Grimontia celer]|uniref:Uncharacterized protein n=1 Tax=Grimontia celer TaxID=1796497 RepID=A0A128EWZ4_9GAMM|nr:hypothetical protein [Grimontia celer]CZF78730.1 hypothetical protein GCE9029_01021 [Grimontia celer]
MKIKSWLGVLFLACISSETRAEERDVYREYVDRSIDRSIPLAVESWEKKLFAEQPEKKFLPVIENFIESVYSDSFRERTATTYRRVFSKSEMKILADNLLTETCASLFNRDFIERMESGAKMSNEDKVSADRCFDGLEGIDNVEEKLNKLAVVNGELYEASFTVHLEEFLEKLKQQKLIFDTAETVKKTLPRTLEDGFDWVDIVGEHMVLEFRYSVNDFFEEDEIYELDTESMFKVACEQFKDRFQGYVSVRYAVFDLHDRLVGEATVTISDCH